MFRQKKYNTKWKCDSIQKELETPEAKYVCKYKRYFSSFRNLFKI